MLRLSRVAIFFLFTLSAGQLAAELPRAHWQRIPVEGGSELLVLYSALPDDPQTNEHTPVLSVLRDTLGDDDPDNDRLRYVWLLTGENRSRFTRWMTREPARGDMPRPLLDLGAPGQGLWKGLVRATVQSMVLDPGGAAMRVPSRSYTSGRQASRTVRLFEALRLLVRLRDEAERGPLAPEEYSRLLARIFVTERTFGGLVTDRGVVRILERDLEQRRLALGRNWELLRQRAEAEGLVFQPIRAEGEAPVAALLWLSLTDLAKSRNRPFDGRFLSIANPWNGNGPTEPDGYTELWHFDADGRRTADTAKAARSEEMLPLALYSLDHPKTPFLLIDFRSTWKPAMREFFRRLTEDLPRTVLGIAPMANLQLWGTQVAVHSIRGRRGAANQRTSRLRATASVRQSVLSMPQLEPEMREQVAQHLRVKSPSMSRQYEGLLDSSQSENGVRRRVRRDRERELAALLQPTRLRWSWLATVATAGLYRYHLPETPERLALLSRERRLTNAAQIVEEALAAKVVVDSSSHRILWAAQELALRPSAKAAAQKRTEGLLQRLAHQTANEQVRQEFLAMWKGTPLVTPVGGGTN